MLAMAYIDGVILTRSLVFLTINSFNDLRVLRTYGIHVLESGLIIDVIIPDCIDPGRFEIDLAVPWVNVRLRLLALVFAFLSYYFSVRRPRSNLIWWRWYSRWQRFKRRCRYIYCTRFSINLISINIVELLDVRCYPLLSEAFAGEWWAWAAYV